MTDAIEPQSLLPTRRSLLSRLQNWDDAEGWREFFSLYWRLIYDTAIRGGLTDDQAQEVVQDTIITVSKKMPGFVYDPKVGSFKSWLLRITQWKILDQKRRRMRDSLRNVSLEEELEASLQDETLVDEWDAEWDRALLDAAMDRARKTADPSYYQIFDLAVVRNWSTARIVDVLGVRRSKVYMAKHRVSALVQKELKQLERKYDGDAD